MARPKKQIVDYFPHNCNHGKTIFIIQNKYGNDGYAMWFKVLELLGQSEGHVYDCNDPAAWEFLLAKTLVNEELALKILQTLADLEAIDTTAWSLKIIWSHNFVENLKDVYVRRKCEKPEFPASLLDYYRQKTPLSRISININPQSKVKESKVKESKVKESKVKESKVKESKEDTPMDRGINRGMDRSSDTDTDTDTDTDKKGIIKGKHFLSSQMRGYLRFTTGFWSVRGCTMSLTTYHSGALAGSHGGLLSERRRKFLTKGNEL